ncbi:MAG: CPBP family intramembrane metalloprotease [Oscillospiraceae bacterium]|nr:CPBP family intramembrane metalloprotease [Oscillospiraceae bacterium]
MTRETLQDAGLAALKLLALLTGYFTVLVILSLVWVVFAGLENYPESLNDGMKVLQILSGGIFMFYLIRYYRKKKFSFRTSAGLVKTGFTLREYGMFAALGTLLNLFCIIVINLLPAQVTASYGVSVSQSLSVGGLLLNCLVILVYAPLMEEIIFRGLCLTYLRGCMKPYAAAVLLSVVFGLSHAQPLWVVYTMLMGMVFSVAAIRSQSIIPSIVAHFSFNFVSLALYSIAAAHGVDWPFGLPVFAVWLMLAAVSGLAAVISIKLYRLTGRCNDNGANCA